MSKFNVGDTVRRTGGARNDIIHGGVYTVERYKTNYTIVLCESSSTRGYDVELFELVQEANSLTDKEVFNAIVDGKSLQYQFVGKPEWYDLKYPEKLTLLDVQRGTYRVRPTEVHIDCTVPYPICKREVTRAFSVDFTNGRITEFFTVVLPDKGVFWNTKEEAEKFRDAVLASLKA